MRFHSLVRPPRSRVRRRRSSGVLATLGVAAALLSGVGASPLVAQAPAATAPTSTAPAAVSPHPVFAPDRADGTYAVGARIGWTATLPRTGRGAPRRTYRWVARRDGGTAVDSGTLDLARGRARLETTLDRPAMLLVEVRPVRPDSTFGARHTGGPGRVLLAAAVAPHAIRAAEPAPDDFDAFWTRQLDTLARVPLDAVERAGESGRAGVRWSTVRLDNVGGAHVYGQLARPAAEGRYPAVVIYQWASPPYPLQKPWVTDRAAEGWLAFNVEPHDVPADMPQAFYDALPAVIRQYPTLGREHRETSDFRRMYLGARRALDYVATRPDWDGRTLVVMGTSMGGQQSFAAAGLDGRVTALVVNVPAGGDVTAARHGRGASYPNWDLAHRGVLTTAPYFDVANFAPRVRAPAFVAMGWIDEVSTPTSIWSVVNALGGPMEVAPMPDAPHNHQATPAQLAPWTVGSARWLDALRRGLPAPVAPSATGAAEAGRQSGGSER